MALQTCQSGQCGTFHLEVGDAVSLIFEVLDFLVLVRVGQWNTELASLRTEETATGYCYTTYHICTGDTVYQFFVGMNHVGSRCTEIACPT